MTLKKTQAQDVVPWFHLWYYKRKIKIICACVCLSVMLSFLRKYMHHVFNNDECNFLVKINQQILTLLIHELFPDFCFIILKQLNTKRKPCFKNCII